MSIQEILQKLFVFANSETEGTYIQITKENAIKLYDYIDNLEDKEMILYMLLGGKKNDKSNK